MEELTQLKKVWIWVLKAIGYIVLAWLLLFVLAFLYGMIVGLFGGTIE